MELLCPAGSLPAVEAAIEHGADAVYLGFKDATNARHFAGLNFTPQKLMKAAQVIHDRGKALHIAINTFAHPQKMACWHAAVDQAVDLGADVLIVADLAVMAYAAQRYPHVALHVSVQASATNAAAIRFYQQQFNVQRVVLPRVLSLHQVKQLARETTAELEVFAFGSLCIMAEGRCYLSSYLTGESPNTVGACSPAKFVRWEEDATGLTSRLNNILIDRYGPEDNAAYPTLCKGRFNVGDNLYHALEEPTSLNTLGLLPELLRTGIKAVKIEGRQRSPAYVAQVTKVWRAALDSVLADPTAYTEQAHWQSSLSKLAEGTQTTLGAYHKAWQ